VGGGQWPYRQRTVLWSFRTTSSMVLRHITDMQVGSLTVWGDVRPIVRGELAYWPQAIVHIAKAVYRINHSTPKPDFVIDTGDIVDHVEVLDLGLVGIYITICICKPWHRSTMTLKSMQFQEPRQIQLSVHAAGKAFPCLDGILDYDEFQDLLYRMHQVSTRITTISTQIGQTELNPLWHLTAIL